MIVSSLVPSYATPLKKSSEPSVSEIMDLKLQDARVRTRVESSMTTMGQPGSIFPTYEFTRGPDKKLYVVDGKITLRINGLDAGMDPESILARIGGVKKLVQSGGTSGLVSPATILEVSDLERKARQAIDRQQTSAVATEPDFKGVYTPNAGKSAFPERPSMFDQLA